MEYQSGADHRDRHRDDADDHRAPVEPQCEQREEQQPSTEGDREP